MEHTRMEGQQIPGIRWLVTLRSGRLLVVEEISAVTDTVSVGALDDQGHSEDMPAAEVESIRVLQIFPGEALPSVFEVIELPRSDGT